MDDLFDSKLDPESFDLVHARYVIAPLGRGSEQVAAHRRLVRPGGSLVLEEWDLGSWHFNPPAPAAERLIRLLSEVFAALGGEAGRGLPGLLSEIGIEEPELDAHVIALKPGHPYLRLPLHFSVALESRLNEMIGRGRPRSATLGGRVRVGGTGQMGHDVHAHPVLGRTTLTEEAVDLDELVFHPWTVQGPRDVLTLVGGSGSHVVDADGRRYLDFSSQLVFTNLGHQHPRIVAAIKQQADRLCTLAPGPCIRRPRRSGANDRRGRPGRARARALHHGRDGGHRARGADGSRAQRTTEGARGVPLVPRLDDDLDPPHGRPAPLGLGHRRGGRGPLLRPLPVSLGVRIDHARGRVRAGARTSRAGDPSRRPVDDRRAGPWSR